MAQKVLTTCVLYECVDSDTLRRPKLLRWHDVQPTVSVENETDRYCSSIADKPKQAFHNKKKYHYFNSIRPFRIINPFYNNIPVKQVLHVDFILESISWQNVTATGRES